jgi:cytochrome c peroxidase
MINSSNPLGTDNRFHNIGVAARKQNFEALAGQALGILKDNSTPEALDKLALETDMSELGRFLVTKQRQDIGSFKTEQLRNVGLTAPYMHDGSLHTDKRLTAQNEAAFREQQALAAKKRPFRDNVLAHREMLPFEQRVMGPTRSLFYSGCFTAHFTVPTQ